MSMSLIPVFPLKERRRNESPIEEQRPIDTKVKGLVLEKIGGATGALLSSATAPQIVTLLLPGFESGSKTEFFQKKRRRSLRRIPMPRKAPIGLMPVDLEGWVNALMQFILYVPGFPESFHFAPHSFYPICEFIDQYHEDVLEGKTISQANGSALFRLFTLKFSDLSLLEIFQIFLQLLRPKWRLFNTDKEALKTALADLFLLTNSIPKQMVAEGGVYYDLSAFIEKRPDGGKVHHVAYVKVEGAWYQCDDDRITQLRSDMLQSALQRALLSHYKKVF